MSVDTIERDNAALATLIDHINAHEEPWGAAVVRRDFLRTMTKEAFILAIMPSMQGASDVQIFNVNERNITVLWRGKQKSTYVNLRGFISSSLVLPSMKVQSSVLMSYADPRVQGDEIKTSITARISLDNHEDDKIFSGTNEEEINDKNTENEASLKASREQADLFNEITNQKAYRSQLHILVVEDLLFSQKLLCEILRGVRMRNNNESPFIDAAQGIHEAWKLFLNKAPDLTFIDLNLMDGSGHTLARAIKELDPMSRVIIVTANNYEEELGVARQNNVDGFIAKPYNKKQIIDCVDTYISATRGSAKVSRLY